MIRGQAKTTMTVTLDDLATLRFWLDEGRTQTSERHGFNEDGQPNIDGDDPALREINKLDDKLARAVQRCYR